MGKLGSDLFPDLDQGNTCFRANFSFFGEVDELGFYRKIGRQSNLVLACWFSFGFFMCWDIYLFCWFFNELIKTFKAKLLFVSWIDKLLGFLSENLLLKPLELLRQEFNFIVQRLNRGLELGHFGKVLF